jgi:hypothetical protein
MTLRTLTFAPLLAAAALAGCAVNPQAGPDPAGNAGEKTATEHESLMSTIGWSYAGHPFDARIIAACYDGTVYAMNADKSIWVSQGGGADGTWTWVTTAGDAAQIACTDDVLFAFNNDRSLWWRYRWQTGWSWNYAGHPGGAREIFGDGAEGLYAVNDDNSLWFNNSGFGNDNAWSWLGRPANATWIGASGPTSEAVFMAINYGPAGNTVYDNNQFGSDWGWSQMPIDNVTENPYFIAGGPYHTFYVLDDQFVLWKGVLQL